MHHMAHCVLQTICARCVAYDVVVVVVVVKVIVSIEYSNTNVVNSTFLMNPKSFIPV